MRWWSQPQPDPPDHPRSSVDTKVSEPPPLPQTPPDQADPVAEPSATSPTRDELAYEDLKSLFSQINPSAARAAAAEAKTPTPQRAPTDYATSLYPSTMSCSGCFDQAYYCSSVGGQLNNIYRYGGLRSCSDLWRQWRFCMRTKVMGEAERKRRIWEWERERAAKYKLGRSSEGVWEGRRERLEEPFGKSSEGFW